MMGAMSAEDVKRLAQLLNEAGVEYALVGGYAIAAHGFNRFSEDIDILVNPAAVAQIVDPNLSVLISASSRAS
jgi:hypothetical protein